jgi:hypothetical protein
MKVFVSWSGDRSQELARAVYTLLPDAIQGIDVWMSEHEISAGSRWGVELHRELETSNFGIICLTPENLNAPWLLFEAGSLAKSVSDSHVIPLLLGIRPTDVTFPLAQFQSVESTKEGIFKLLNSINAQLSEPMKDERLERVFQRWWPDMELRLKEIMSRGSKIENNTIIRDDRAILDEILQLVRGLNSGTSNPGYPRSYSEVVKHLEAARTYHVDRYAELIRKKEEIISKGEKPSGMYDDYSDESQWLIEKIDSALHAFTSK